jgi:hypothetical protein
MTAELMLKQIPRFGKTLMSDLICVQNDQIVGINWVNSSATDPRTEGRLLHPLSCQCPRDEMYRGLPKSSVPSTTAIRAMCRQEDKASAVSARIS